MRAQRLACAQADEVRLNPARRPTFATTDTHLTGQPPCPICDPVRPSASAFQDIRNHPWRHPLWFRKAIGQQPLTYASARVGANTTHGA